MHFSAEVKSPLSSAFSEQSHTEVFPSPPGPLSSAQRKPGEAWERVATHEVPAPGEGEKGYAIALSAFLVYAAHLVRF